MRGFFIRANLYKVKHIKIWKWISHGWSFIKGDFAFMFKCLIMLINLFQSINTIRNTFNHNSNESFHGFIILRFVVFRVIFFRVFIFNLVFFRGQSETSCPKWKQPWNIKSEKTIAKFMTLTIVRTKICFFSSVVKFAIAPTKRADKKCFTFTHQ